jgi:hypothetical protein
MPNPAHLAILKQGAETWNAWRKANPDVRPDLSQADLRERDLSRADLSKADLGDVALNHTDLSGAKLWQAWAWRAHLAGARLYGSELVQAYLFGADLTRADLQYANLTAADLTGANLTLADLRKANLMKADLSWATLREANLAGAMLLEANTSRADLSQAILVGSIAGDTLFVRLDLRSVIGLETVEHRGPSTIGIDTLYLSKGRIPEVFLRGCGVPDEITALAHEIARRGAPYYSCFISYSSQDDAFARRLHTDLQAAGVRCWFAPEDLSIGDRIRDGIDRAVCLHDKLLLILSAASVASQWVEQEVESALEKERALEEQSGAKRTVLFPIRVDDAVMDADVAWARLIKNSRNIGDFTRWQDPVAYQSALARLLRDLQATP